MKTPRKVSRQRLTAALVAARTVDHATVLGERHTAAEEVRTTIQQTTVTNAVEASSNSSPIILEMSTSHLTLIGGRIIGISRPEAPIAGGNVGARDIF